MEQEVIRAAPTNDAVQLAISEDQVSMLVEQFYEEIKSDDVLGPIFSTHIGNDWGPHLVKMKTFWRSVLLKTGEYKGKPVPVHLKISEINTDAFKRWLALFSKTTTELFTPEIASSIDERAGRIATSLWLSRSSDPYISPPNWANTTDTISTTEHPGEPKCSF